MTMNPLAYVLPSVLRNPRRTGAYLIGTVITVALVSSVLFFVVASAHDMTQRAIAPVRVDMQAVLSDPHGAPDIVQRALVQRPEIAKAERFALAGFQSAQVSAGNRIGQTSGGKIMAVDPSYLSAFRAPVVRQGSLVPGSAVISLDMGTNLGARVGDLLTLTFPKPVGAVKIRITGIATMQNTDILFAPLDPVLRAIPRNPPANVVILDYRWFEATLKPRLLASTPSTTTGGFVLRNNVPVLEQVHFQLRRNLIPADPSQAKTYVSQLRRSLDLSPSFTGHVTTIDNVSAALDVAQSDVLWAQVIFVFLAIPGVVLAAALSRYVTATTIDTQRRELALLRIRGVGPRQVRVLLGSALLLVALVGVVLGIAGGWITTRLAAGSTAAGAGDPLVLRSLLLALLAGLILGMASTLWPLLGIINVPIVEARRRVTRGDSPLWSRLYLDIICLVLAVIVYEVMQQNGGFKPVLNAEGNPTISLSIFTFLAPLLFWIGAILLLVRISRRLVSSSGRLLGGLFGSGVVGELATRTLERRSGSLHQAMVLVAMAVTFSTALVTFVHTYDQQQRVDAELTLGSDVRVDVAHRSQSNIVASRLSSVPGVTAYTPFRSTVAYVGSEIQDIFGLDLRSFPRATRLADSFFIGSTASETLNRLRATPNGIIVSAETATGYSLAIGDTLVLRLRQAGTQTYVPVRFKLVGVAKEFATAPKDAFLVANLGYIQSATGETGVDLFLIKTSGDPRPVASALRARFANGPLVHVDDLSTVQQQLSTSLTSLNLSGLTRIDYFFTVIMLVTGLLVFALAVLLERRRDFAMLQVMGTTSGQVRLLLLTEVGYAVVVGCVFGLLVGLGFAYLLIQILTSIFDPPPDVMALPVSTLAGLVLIVVLSGAAATMLASQRLGRLNLAQTLRDT